MEPWKSWLAFAAIVGSLLYYYGALDGLLGKNSDKSGTNRGRTLSRAGDTDLNWAESDTKTKSKAKTTKTKAPRKSVQKAVQEVGNKAEAALSGVTSPAGADADDDLSPEQSPSLISKIADKVPSGKDVSDMLDSKNLPTVLKIGASEKPARSSKPQQQKLEQQTKSKHQAKNEKKKEAEKAARAAAEEERKKLEEKQRRTAREARGEAPRNGVMSSQPPTSSAWNRVAAPAASEPAPGQLLDTIDATSTASSATNGTAPTPESTSYSNLPSEEDQLAAALAESAWTTVSKGKKKKANGEAIGEGSDSGAAEPAPAPAKPTPAAVVKKENAKLASRFEVLSQPISGFNDPRDSDWPVV